MTVLGFDFAILWSAGQHVLSGQSPYSVPGFYYPPLVAWFFALIALLPISTAFILWTLAHIGMLVAVFRRQALLWLLAFPVIFVVNAGQNEWLWWGLALAIPKGTPGWRGPILAALITLKPQTALVLLPFHLWHWLKTDWRTLARFAALTAALWTIPALLMSGWLAGWLANMSHAGQTNMANSPGIWSLTALGGQWLPLCAVIALALAAFGLSKHEAITRTCLSIASPTGMHYSQYELVGTCPAWLFVALSWSGQLLSQAAQNFVPLMIVPLGVIVWQHREMWGSHKAMSLSHA